MTDDVERPLAERAGYYRERAGEYDDAIGAAFDLD